MMSESSDDLQLLERVRSGELDAAGAALVRHRPRLKRMIEARLDRRLAGRVDPSDVVLVIEIVSPGSRRTDRVMKAYEYAKAGIEHYWIVDLDAEPNERFLAHSLRDGTYHGVEVLFSDRVRTKEPLALDFTLVELTEP